MTYREYRVPAQLRGLAECGWSNLVPDGVVLDVLPDGCMDLVWTGVELVVAGPDTGPHPYRPVPGRHAAGFRFAPGRLPSLLGVPAAVLRDERVSLDEFHPGLARRATARLEGGAPPAEVLLGLALELPGTRPEPAVQAVVHHLRCGRSAAATADGVGWTTRSLHRHCTTWFGYGPAVLRRILRLRAALALLRGGLPPAGVAAQTGYADQPHLSRELRELTGRTPRQLADRR